jgi:large subunit ribosomal protein L17
MRHGKKVNHLGRTSSHRKAMLSNMASSLILHKRIQTTTAKAKALKVYVEPLITKSKNDTTASRRVVFSYLRNKYAVTELFRDVSQKVMDRPGGYTRIIKLPNRLGDNAEICIIELVDYNTLLLDAKKDEKKTTRRSRRGGTKTTKAEIETTKKEDVKAEKTGIETKAKEQPAEKVHVDETVAEMEEIPMVEKTEVVEEPKAEVEPVAEVPEEPAAETPTAKEETEK